MQAVIDNTQPLGSQISRSGPTKEVGKAAFFWLCAFYIVYCARPEDWIPGLLYLHLAKITAVAALWGLFSSLGKTKRKLKDLPVESNYLLAMILLLFLGSLFSPIWKGGAFSHAIDFAKVYVAWALTFLLVTDFDRLKRIIFIQASSVAVIAAISIIKGHNYPRLSGVIGGMYSNPNDLAFCIVLSVPFCLALMLSSKNVLAKMLWGVGILIMMTALLLTASRGGIIELAVAGTVCVWHFGVRGRRLYLIVAVVLIGSVLMLVAGKKMQQRIESLSAGVSNEEVDGSYEARKYLMGRALEAIKSYPVFGIGINNFMTYSGDWHEVHMSYLQIAAEGGIPVFVLYMLFFKRGFRNLRLLRKRKDLSPTDKLFVGALHSSLVGFVVGALFSPVAYQFFSYFAVAYTSAMLKIIEEQKQEQAAGLGSAKPSLRPLDLYAPYGGPGGVVPVR